MAAVEALKMLWNKIGQGGGFAKHLSAVTILDGGNGNVTASMKVALEHCNPNGNLHGAFQTLIVDNLSGIGLLTHPNVDSAGPTVQLDMKYMRAAAIGDEILIKSRTDKVGKQFAFLTVEILNNGTGQLISSATHTIYLGMKGNDKLSKSYLFS